MTAAVAERLLTPEEFYELEDSVAYELVDGALEERHVSKKSSYIGSLFVRRVGNHAEDNGLGSVWGSDLGLQIFIGQPRRIPRADCVFVSFARLGADADSDTPYLNVAPELLVEVVSPTERAARTDRKVQEYIAAGVRLVWVVFPETRRVLVYRADGTTQLVPEGGTLSGEDVLPGFELPLASVFGEIALSAQP